MTGALGVQTCAEAGACPRERERERGRGRGRTIGHGSPAGTAGVGAIRCARLAATLALACSGGDRYDVAPGGGGPPPTGGPQERHDAGPDAADATAPLAGFVCSVDSVLTPLSPCAGLAGATVTAGGASTTTDETGAFTLAASLPITVEARDAGPRRAPTRVVAVDGAALVLPMFDASYRDDLIAANRVAASPEDPLAVLYAPFGPGVRVALDAAAIGPYYDEGDPTALAPGDPAPGTVAAVFFNVATGPSTAHVTGLPDAPIDPAIGTIAVARF